MEPAGIEPATSCLQSGLISPTGDAGTFTATAVNVVVTPVGVTER
jgi:hypothetical protein